MSDVLRDKAGGYLVDHDTIENTALFEVSSRDFFDLGVALDFEVQFVEVSSAHDNLSGLERKVTDEGAPAKGKLRSDAGLKSFHNFGLVIDVDFLGDFVQNGDGILECSEVAIDNFGGVDVLLDEGPGSDHHFSSQDYHGSGAIADFFILGLI